ncbi:MAG: UDP-2,3-diacylglucosamine diphosphatase [candidate division Zixibacteria bacterium]|nr:UDP-2,3-diacylglucosamine diphosphatase [candidate division Zixibacteria bacterium]
MNESTPILIFSDAHFGAHSRTQETLKIERFVGFLAWAQHRRAEVFFLGDLFDFWFEYRHWMPKVPVEIPASIRAFTAGGGAFHLIIGNHDCWAEDYFERQLGMQVHRGDLTVMRQGLQLYLSHGDGMARSDRGYRILKRILRWRLNTILYRLWPADWAFRAAHFFSGRSRELTTQREPKFLEEYDQSIAVLLASGFDAVVIGHIHKGWVRRIGAGWSVNSGEFYEEFNYVVLENGTFRIECWSGIPPK